MSLVTLEVPKKAYLSRTKIPRLPRLGLGRLLGSIIGAYADAVSGCYGAAMGLSHENHAAKTESDRDY
jgi:hypothetical protein